MTSTTYNYISQLAPIVALIVPVWQLLYNRSENKWYKRITKLGWWLFAISIYTIIFNSLALYASKKEGDEQVEKDSVSNHKVDSLLGCAEKLQYSTDSSNHTIHSMDSFMRAYCKVSMEKDKTGAITYNYNNFTQTTAKTKLCLVKFMTSNNPDKTITKLCNGDYMLLKYRPHNNGKSITIPYMRGKEYVSSFTVWGTNFLEVEFNKETGTFNLGDGFGFGNQLNGEPGYDSVNFSFLATLPVKE